MISPERALQRIARHCRPLATEEVSLDAALERTLAEDVSAPFPLPRFDNSAMDGYAVRSRDTATATPRRSVRLALLPTIFAGARGGTLRAGHACGIMTGAPLPRGADAVIPVERAVVDAGALVVRAPVPRHRHVRRRGEDIRSGARMVKKGTVIHPGVIACLASVGRNRVMVVRRPRVAVITTGDETVEPGGQLHDGQIYDSNSYMLVAMLRQAGVEPVRVRRVGDRRAALARAVRAALEVCDVLITVGGVSVGEHDFLRPVLKDLGVREIFWRVSQKPGKPIYFGGKGTKRVFGLPGNPASAFVCFYVYVLPALERLSGLGGRAGLAREAMMAGSGIVPDARRWLFLRGRSDGGVSVTRLSRQGSHMVTALADTDRLIAVAPDGRRRRRVETLRLPHERGRRS